MTSVPPTQAPAAPETDVRLTEAEREAWDVDPDLWPHTPPLHIFRALMDEDDNVWWRASGGHGLNAYDAAIERIDELAERVRVVEGERDAHREAAASWHITARDNRDRAESAEAAHRALQAAVEALAGCWEAEARRLGRSLSELMLREAAADLRALLAGGEER